MRDFAWMLRRHEEGVLNFLKMRITNGVVEGMNPLGIDDDAGRVRVGDGIQGGGLIAVRPMAACC